MNDAGADNPIMEIQQLTLLLPAGLCLKSHLTLTPDVMCWLPPRLTLISSGLTRKRLLPTYIL